MIDSNEVVKVRNDEEIKDGGGGAYKELLILCKVVQQDLDYNFSPDKYTSRTLFQRKIYNQKYHKHTIYSIYHVIVYHV